VAPSSPATSQPPATPTSRTRPGSASIVVTVPALTLLGAGDEPALLDGYGPIDFDTARRLAGESATWTRLLTHPLTGVPLALDRTSYRVTAALRRWLGVTSPTCIFPGCGRAARACDIDHLTAWSDGGTTDADNLEPECRPHHRLRHETKWTPVRDPDSGDVRWRSPLGHETEVDPPPF
ncbi:HNH endonuclease, partial [Microbacterium sp. HMWF026]|uniref:HNH endonuclease signature motif containing protein n=1 Tax=Microbacterium sp. HMWF026 TaxID=2056861 RepID=UPI000D48C269